MVRILDSSGAFSASRPKRRFSPKEPRLGTFPIQRVQIDWKRLIDKREMILDTVDTMPAYLLKPEILDLMWTTGAQISEVLALTPSHFIDDGCDFMVALCTLKQRPERSTNTQLARSLKRTIPIVAPMLIDWVQSYLYAGNFRRDERIFTMARQAVNRHTHNLVERVGGAPIKTTCHTFRHNFANSPATEWAALQIVSQLLGHKSIESTEICTNVLTADGGHFLDGVDFH